MMQPENKNMDDLEYLAQLGFEKVAVNEKDMDDLLKRVRNRSFSYNNGLFFGIISVITGMFLGITVFFTIYNAPTIYSAPKNSQVQNPPPEYALSIKALDTVEVTSENFISTPVKISPPTIKKENELIETAETLHSTPILKIDTDASLLKESQIRYIPNAPVIFLHDRKITDYSTLYFRHHKFVTLKNHNGLDPAYANKEEASRNDVLNHTYNYYLHQAIGDAMLQFNKKNYSKCLEYLTIISEINPNDINCLFYSGMCFYYKKNYEAAIKHFNACLDHSNNTFLPEAQYYKALSLYEQGKKEEAFVLLKEIVKDNGFYAGKAKKLIN